MREREKQHLRGMAPESGESPPEGELTSIRAQAEDLLEGVDETIDRILSGDSRSFLEANRQRGGQ